MDLHLVGGFLGSGKTTAIAAAARLLVEQERRVGVVTNDQGLQLVDTELFRARGLPTGEVGGGCFCCNYDELVRVVRQLAGEARPELIFAESVGSCADIVATVAKPLRRDAGVPARLASFSVFADCRLLARFLSEQSLPFSADILYIFAKQIEEAGLLVINKADLMPAGEMADLLRAARKRYPRTQVRVQSSLRESDVAEWLRWLDDGKGAPPDRSLSIDYDRYGAGEADLAWLDCAIDLYVPPYASGGAGPTEVVGAFFRELSSEMKKNGYGVGHVKALVRGEHGEAKISLTATGEDPAVPEISGSRHRLLLNARVQAGADQMRELVAGVLVRVANSSGCLWSMETEDAFHPSYPRPRHRMD